MPIGLIALAAFIATLIVINVVLRRNMGEAMLVAFVVTCLFAGTDVLAIAWSGIVSTTSNVVVYAALGFVFMSYLIDQLGLIQKILNFLNSIFSRVRGGPAFVDTVGSAAMGALAGSNSGNAASTGAITGPWMVREGWSRPRAATVMAGNAGMGAALPPSTSMVIMLGFAGGLASTGSVYMALLITGLYQIAYRVLLVLYFVRKDGVQIGEKESMRSIVQRWKEGRAPLSIYLGALIPIAITVGPIATFFEESTSVGESLGDIQIISWIPILIILIACIVAWRQLPRSAKGVYKLIEGGMPRLASIAPLLFFAIAASTVLTDLGLTEDIEGILEAVTLPTWLLIAAIVILVAVVAGPMTSTATVTAIGQVSMLALISAGLDPVIAITVILVAASTEGSTPPASAPIFIASGIVRAKPESIFIPLIGYYLLPALAIAFLVGIGLLPIPLGS